MKRSIAIALLSLLALTVCAHERTTVAYAERDTCTLYMDIYRPGTADVQKPAILYMFGGGFLSGDKRSGIDEWFGKLNDDGYTVISIDYRLGLKGAKLKGLKFIKQLEKAIDIAVEDLFSATLFLLENGKEYGIDACNLVLTGSSAGAIAVLQGEYEICNGSELAKVLPEGFNYSGVIPFSGAIFDRHNPIRFPVKPCPMLLFHGIEDHLVPYRKIAFFNTCFAGSDEIVRVLGKNGFPCSIYRYADRGHEVSIYGGYSNDMVTDFIRKNIMEKSGVNFDCTVNDPASPNPAWGKTRPDKLYN